MAFMTGMGPYCEEIFVEYFCLFCIVVVKFLSVNFSYVCHCYFLCHRLKIMGKRKVFARLFVFYFSSSSLCLNKTTL